MIIIDQNITIMPTQIGEIMAKFYVAFETMKLFTQVCKTFKKLFFILITISFLAIWKRNLDANSFVDIKMQRVF